MMAGPNLKGRRVYDHAGRPITDTNPLPKDSMRPGTDIKVMADSSSNDMAIAAGFDLILVDV